MPNENFAPAFVVQIFPLNADVISAALSEAPTEWANVGSAEAMSGNEEPSKMMGNREISIAPSASTSAPAGLREADQLETLTSLVPGRDFGVSLTGLGA